MSFYMVVFFVCVFAANVMGSEPVCSKFHYEEQLLEKMIRQEVLVETLVKDIGDTKKQVNVALESLQTEEESFKVEMEGMKKAQIHAQEEEVQELRNIRADMVQPNVAFQAKALLNRKLIAGETLVFQNTIFNHGNGYNNITGKFTAPYAGIYSFYLHLCLELTNSHIYYEILSEAKSIMKGRIVDSAGSYWSCSSVEVIADLQQHEKVAVKMVSTSITAGSSVVWESSDVESVFSGFIVFAA